MRRLHLTAFVIFAAALAACSDDKTYEDGKLTWEGSAPLVSDAAASGAAWTLDLSTSTKDLRLNGREQVFVRFPEDAGRTFALEPKPNANGAMVAGLTFNLEASIRGEDGTLRECRSTRPGADFDVTESAPLCGFPGTLQSLTLRFESDDAPKSATAPVTKLDVVIAERPCVQHLTTAWEAERKGRERAQSSPEPRCVH